MDLPALRISFAGCHTGINAPGQQQLLDTEQGVRRRPCLRRRHAAQVACTDAPRGRRPAQGCPPHAVRLCRGRGTRSRTRPPLGPVPCRAGCVLGPPTRIPYGPQRFTTGLAHRIRRPPRGVAHGRGLRAVAAVILPGRDTRTSTALAIAYAGSTDHAAQATPRDTERRGPADGPPPAGPRDTPPDRLGVQHPQRVPRGQTAS